MQREREKESNIVCSSRVFVRVGACVCVCVFVGNSLLFIVDKACGVREMTKLRG